MNDENKTSPENAASDTSPASTEGDKNQKPATQEPVNTSKVFKPTGSMSAFDEVDDEAIADTEPSSESVGKDEVPTQDPQDISTNEYVNYGPNAHVTLDIGSPLNEPLKKSFSPEQDYLNLPPISFSEFGPVTASYKNYKLAINDQTSNWRNSAQNVRSMYVQGDAFGTSFERDNSDWRQSVEVGTENIRADRPKFPEATGNLLSGEAARLRIRSILSAGSHTRVPLYHSGIWITIKAPTEAELLELDARIAQEEIELGRSSAGLVYSSIGVYLASMVVDFILDHVSETSYQTDDMDDLKDVILQPDYQQMVWGMLCSIYPDGYLYQQPCLSNPFKCLHIETARLNFGKMSFVDNNALNDFQKQHIRKRKAGSMSKLDVERYQSEHKFQQHSVVRLHDRLSLELKVPTLREYEESGRDWLSNTIDVVNRAFGKEMSEDERNAAIARQANMTIMQQYSHWVRMISLTKEEIHIEDRDTIQDSLADLTSDDDAFTNFFEGIKTYISKICVNVHGIPKYPCPACNESPSVEMLRHPMVFPIDLVEAFFILVGQRIRRILGRRMK